ncbi:HTH domain-containing protein [Halococcus sp. IIIV-5B]|uniref:HTH domain-containing protein n=1 Tax=Halococcus sp. IIIV-5B TaxID=2321230 RepID=UPI000E73181A|nr:HTH domain-containing protein [Halococcus sp. IIIV-5B]RJT03870.1 hypothetical protein D3261_10530 [Halococcus sp. IIIV-5B]
MAVTRTPAEAPTDEHRRDYTVELFVRSLAPAGARPEQEGVVDRIEGLQRAGRIAASTVTVWGGGIAPGSAFAGTEPGRTILEAVEEFTRWASANDLRFPSAFEERECTSIAGDDCQRVIGFPLMCLATRENGELRCVAPWSNDVLTHTIHDCLDELADEDGPTVHDWDTDEDPV